MIWRGIAAFFGVFAILNLLGDLFSPGFDANLWWIDLSPLPQAVANVVLLVGGVALLTQAVRPVRSTLARRMVAGPIIVFALFAMLDALRFYRLLHHHQIRTPIPFPFSAIIATAMAAIVWQTLRAKEQPAKLRRTAFAAAFAICMIAFPAGQMIFFGHTDYRRRADVIVVFGARAHADGTASGVLADRVATACDLYHEGLADKLIFSGGPGDGAINEPHAMRRLAMRLGVPSEAIYLDGDGLNTEKTVADTTTLFRQLHARRVLAVSHGYHLPRVKLAFARAGWDVYTVPAVQHSPLPGAGRFLFAREVVGLWAYYLHAARA